MHRAPRLRTPLALITAVTMLAVAPLAEARSTKARSASSSNCTTSTSFSKPFLPWLDIADYVPSPGGDFEGKLTGWTLSGGAKVVSGNESFYVRSTSDRRSLALPAGSSATSAPICVGLDYPIMRFFLRNSGSLLGSLKVDVLGVGLLGQVRQLASLPLFGTKAWAPSLPVVLLSNVDALLTSNGMTSVKFRFTPIGGSWQIDDVYVDPYRRR